MTELNNIVFFFFIPFDYFKQFDCNVPLSPVGQDCKLRRLDLNRRVRHLLPNEHLWYDTKLYQMVRF